MSVENNTYFIQETEDGRHDNSTGNRREFTAFEDGSTQKDQITSIEGAHLVESLSGNEISEDDLTAKVQSARRLHQTLTFTDVAEGQQSMFERVARASQDVDLQFKTVRNTTQQTLVKLAGNEEEETPPVVERMAA